MAAMWVFENQGLSDIDSPILPGELASAFQHDASLVDPSAVAVADSSDTSDMMDDNQYKMVFVVNLGLNMTPGKVAAQVAHAALGLYRTVAESDARHLRWLRTWESQGYVF